MSDAHVFLSSLVMNSDSLRRRRLRVFAFLACQRLAIEALCFASSLIISSVFKLSFSSGFTLENLKLEILLVPVFKGSSRGESLVWLGS